MRPMRVGSLQRMCVWFLRTHSDYLIGESMNNVITSEQARKITGGRTPLVPVEYESACKSLAACVDLDEAKYWSEKADILAAWAKIYRHDEAGRAAKRLRVHAFRRMGQIAGELRPRNSNCGTRGRDKGKFVSGTGSYRGAAALLKEKGLSSPQVQVARRLARTSDSDFDALISRPGVPGLNTIRNTAKGASEAFKKLSGAFRRMAYFTKEESAVDLAKSVHQDEVDLVRKYATQIAEWIDSLDQALPKKK